MASSFYSPPPNVVGSSYTFPTVTSSVTDTVTVTPPSPHRSSPLQNLSPSILIIVTVLAVTVIVSVALCFLLRHLNRRCLRRLNANPSAATTPIITSGRRVSPEIPSSVIDSLPLFAFSSVTRRSATSAADCAVCLSKFHNNDLLRLLPLCCHAFHADCIDTWLRSNLSCPLCRSTIFASDSDLAKVLQSPSVNSFRIEIGNVSSRETNPDANGESRSRSYSIGSFEYFVEEESEIPFSEAHRRSLSDRKEFSASTESPAMSNEAALAGEVAGTRNWLKEYVDRVSASISSRTMSFRNSGRFFTGSSRRSDVVPIPIEYDVEGNQIGEEISEMFRWLSGV